MLNVVNSLKKAEFSLAEIYGLDGGLQRLHPHNLHVKDKIRKRMKKGKLTNIEVIRGETDNPHLPPNSLDAILISNAYHHMDEYQSMLAHMRRALKPQGRMVILAYDRTYDTDTPGAETRQEQTEKHEIGSRLVQEELREAGFEITERRESFIRLVELEWMIVAQPSSDKE